ATRGGARPRPAARRADGPVRGPRAAAGIGRIGCLRRPTQFFVRCSKNCLTRSPGFTIFLSDCAVQHGLPHHRNRRRMMAKTQTNSPEREPFKTTDFTKSFADFNRMFADYGKLFANGKAPLFDVEQVLAAQRKNVEAITAANQVVLEGVQAVARRQAEIVRRAMEDFTQASKELTAGGSPEGKFAKQAELTK